MARKSKRENGTGTVYKRKDVKSRPWVAYGPAKAVMDPGTQRVRMIQPALGSYATAQEAKDALDAYRRNPSRLFNASLEQIHDRWMDVAYRDISQDFINNYNSCWYKLRTLYRDRFRDLRAHDYQAIIDYYDSDHAKEGHGGQVITDKETGGPVMRGPLSFSSLSKIKALLTSMYTYALQEDVVSKNYASFIILPPKGESKHDRFTDLELQKIKQAIGTVEMADLIYIMCNTGHRIGEFVSITPDMIRRYNGRVIICGGNKTEAGENKVVPVTVEVGTLIESWAAKGGDTVFCRTGGAKWTEDNFRDHFKQALGLIGVRVLTPHATRRTYSTRLSAAGVSQVDIIALMGHENFETDRESYIIQEAQTLINAVDKLA